jgi:hypothetical protein
MTGFDPLRSGELRFFWNIGSLAFAPNNGNHDRIGLHWARLLRRAASLQHARPLVKLVDHGMREESVLCPV